MTTHDGKKVIVVPNGAGGRSGVAQPTVSGFPIEKAHIVYDLSPTSKPSYKPH